MKLAEAVIERKKLAQAIKETEDAITTNARVAEGEKPDESVPELLTQLGKQYDRHLALVQAINAANNAAQWEYEAGGRSISQLIVQRENLQARERAYRGFITYASRPQYGMREDKPMILQVPIADLRTATYAMSDWASRLDVIIQRLDWEIDVDFANIPTLA